jgi:HAD superfamily hydrolase (TIGR01509 family)
MATVRAGGRRFDVDVVVFDKDDTLVDLNATWGQVARSWIGALAGDDEELHVLLSTRLGYDRASGRLIPDTILATHTIAEIGDHTGRLLHHHGWSTVQIEHGLASARRTVRADTAELPLQPLADLQALFGELRSAGLAIGVFTSDDEQPTRHFLDSCGVTALVDVVITGDRVEHPKPHGHGLHEVARATGSSTDRLVMVGDSLHDHGSARDAGTWFIAVGHDSAAAAHADASVANVGEIRAS